MKKNTYICVLHFIDGNQPAIRIPEQTEQLALATISHWAKNFAAIKTLSFWTPEGDRVCFNPQGVYAFTIPAKTCQSLGLKP